MLEGSVSLRLGLYRAAAASLRRLPFGGTLGASLRGRATAAWWNAVPTARGPRIWLHASSVGEALAAEPVIRRLAVTVPGLDVICSWSSPSMEGWGLGFPVSASGFVPPETPTAIRHAFDSVAPDLVLFSRSDLWPEMLLAARDRGVPVAVSGGVIRDRSWRLRWPVRGFLSRLYAGLRFVGAVSAKDRERWLALGVPGEAAAVTGDPRHDQVLERLTRMEIVRQLGRRVGGRPVLVAGSVEEGESLMLTRALALTRRAHPEALLLMVPHDPARTTLKRYSGVTTGDFRDDGPLPACLVVSERGLLQDLYAGGLAAYVGGGFRGALHAVVEPAAYGMPIIVGPDYRGSPDAARMVEGGGAVVLPRRGAVHALVAHWSRWIESGGETASAGLAARRELHQGAAALTARRLLALLPAAR